MIGKEIRGFENSQQHVLVFEILVRDVGSGRDDVEDVMYHLSDHAPGGSVSLDHRLCLVRIIGGRTLVP
jgi:hypothetical protein